MSVGQTAIALLDEPDDGEVIVEPAELISAGRRTQQSRQDKNMLNIISCWTEGPLGLDMASQSFCCQDTKKRHSPAFRRALHTQTAGRGSGSARGENGEGVMSINADVLSQLLVVDRSAGFLQSTHGAITVRDEHTDRKDARSSQSFMHALLHADQVKSSIGCLGPAYVWVLNEAHSQLGCQHMRLSQITLTQKRAL
eukprot:6203373-Pleurochrysis_carterae.AAC.1